MTIVEEIAKKEKRLDIYLQREEEMLTGGVQSYGVGSRNLQRYNTDLAEVRRAIKQLETEIKELKSAQGGGSARKAVAVIPRDW